MKLFNSWQSDLPSNQCRSKIRSALNTAIKRVDPKFELVIDEATRNESGSIDIVATILKKIDNDLPELEEIIDKITAIEDIQLHDTPDT